MNRDDLHDDSENYDVWCERCQKTHRYYTFTKQDFDRVISEGADKLAAEVDRRAFQEAMKIYGASEPEQD